MLKYKKLTSEQMKFRQGAILITFIFGWLSMLAFSYPMGLNADSSFFDYNSVVFRSYEKMEFSSAEEFADSYNENYIYGLYSFGIGVYDENGSEVTAMSSGNERINSALKDEKFIEKAILYYNDIDGEAFDNEKSRFKAFLCDNDIRVLKKSFSGKEYYFIAFSSVNIAKLIFSDSYVVHFALFFASILSTIVIRLAEKYYYKNAKLNEAKVAFTSAAAHELKTPLSIIENQCEFIMEGVDPEKNDEYIRSIYDESLRMNKLVASLLQYNRLATADGIEKENCMLGEIARVELDKYKPLCDKNMINTEVNISENTKIYGNADLIALVIDNFLSNAVKHTGEGGKIILSVVQWGEQVRLSVFNEGSCINDKNKDNLWDVFYRNDKSRAKNDGNSTGMGLAISKQILELHNYQYGFKNYPNGVEFWFFATNY